jgi:glycine cleavage system T protein (aminomethyltransferase)
MKHTALYEVHKKLGAKMVEFAGWEMPLSYTGTIEEHRAVRETAGLFDVSHLGRTSLEGKGAEPLLQSLLPNDVRTFKIGSARYSVLLNEDGMILDDIVVYRRSPDRFLLCINASNTEKDIEWVQARIGMSSAKLLDLTQDMSQLALQGPQAGEVIRRVSDIDREKIKPWQFMEDRVSGVDALIAKTGYTGDIGYEIYLGAGSAKMVWESLLSVGKEFGIKACGLGARDTLRLEAGNLLYGNDIDETTTPLEAGLEKMIILDKGEFVGRSALLKQKESGVNRRLIGFKLLQKGVPRHDCKIFSDGKEIGIVTSGNFSPFLNNGIGMGYVKTAYAEIGAEILIEIRTKTVPAVVVERPFYKKVKS